MTGRTRNRVAVDRAVGARDTFMAIGVGPIAPGSDIRYAPVVRAGRWLLLTGYGPVDPIDGLPETLQGSDRPARFGGPLTRRQSEAVFERLRRNLASAGGSIQGSVRVDQFYVSADDVNDYQPVRRRALAGAIPPSTSIIVEGLMIDEQRIDVSLVAMADERWAIERVHPPNVAAPAWSGFAPVIAAGDLVFVAGQMADGAMDGLDPKAVSSMANQWGNRPIDLQTEVIVHDRIAPALASAGASLAGLVKVQAFVNGSANQLRFLEAWDRLVGTGAALSVIPASGFNIADGVVEINAIAVPDAQLESRRFIELADINASLGSRAVIAGDLLFLPGLFPVNRDGLVPGSNRGLERLGIPVREQAQFLAATASEICRGAGGDPRRLARLQVFHTPQAAPSAILAALGDNLEADALPVSIVEVAELPVSGALMMIDAWFHLPSLNTGDSIG